MKKVLTPMEIDALRQLKVVRSENELYQNLLSTYYSLIVENADMRNIIADYEHENQELTSVNTRLEEELDFTKKLYSVVNRQNTSLANALKKFVADIDSQGILVKRADGSYDVGI